MRRHVSFPMKKECNQTEAWLHSLIFMPSFYPWPLEADGTAAGAVAQETG
jgi:hypothetical protein